MEGFFYTWIQKRNNPECGIMKTLDRIMGNCHFMEDYKACIASFLPFVTSDHCPAVLHIADIVIKRFKTFRFMNYLADKADFLKVVNENWNIPVKGYSMFVLAKRLKSMKKHMRNLNRKNGNVFVKVKQLRTELKKVQMELEKDPDNPMLREEELIYNYAYREAIEDEEKVLKQKSKIEWLKEGDQNNAYFHNFIKGRFSKSRIDYVYDEDGNKHSGNDIAKKFVEHFHGFLGKEDDVFLVEDPEGLFTKKISAEDVVHMIRPISNDEIRAAIFDIDDNRAPGPDGFSSKFFKASWGIIGGDVCRAIKEFFSSGKLLGELNNTIISLVPKNKNPIVVTDYRPIACCGVVYKGISKVITNRIKGALGKLIDCNQSAFIEGRQISDNILLIQELMNGYNWSNRARRCAFKVDIQKAYDTVSWDFLKIALEKFGFHSTMINWIMICLSTASFSIKVNDEIHGFFKAKRGLRQGDPVSPYLFTIIMEVLNLMIKRQISIDNRFKYHWGCKELQITHLCFADDLILLCHADLVSASILRRGLDEFTIASGLYPSLIKSTAYFGNVTNDEKCKILMVMPFQEGHLPVKCLGIPLVGRSLCKADCRCLIENVKRRIDDWRNKHLSYAGRLQLIASILCSLQVYWASIFILPINVCDSIEMLLKGFLWAANDKAANKASVAWKEICLPKSQGVLALNPCMNGMRHLCLSTYGI